VAHNKNQRELKNVVAQR